MYAPSLARQIHPSGLRHCAGVCQATDHSTPYHGWLVPYRLVPNYIDAYEAVIDLVVVDLSSGPVFVAILPFLIDTGTDVTIIPRRLLKGTNAFPPRKMLEEYSVEGLTGRVVVGHRFRAAMAVASLRSEPPPLSFGVLKPVVVDEDDWPWDYGMLGLDALRRVVMISDADHICLWPRP